MKMDITKRIEWLSKRVNLTKQDKEYVRFVMVEAVTDAVKQVNKTNGIHNVSQCEHEWERIDHKRIHCVKCGQIQSRM